MTPTPRYVEKGEREKLRRENEHGPTCEHDNCSSHKHEVLELLDALNYLDARLSEAVAREAKHVTMIHDMMCNGPTGCNCPNLSDAGRELLEIKRKWDEHAEPLIKGHHDLKEYWKNATLKARAERDALRADADRLQRENAALREALKLIRDCTGDGNAERVAENALAQLDASVQIPPPDPTIMDYVPGTEPRGKAYIIKNGSPPSEPGPFDNNWDLMP